MANKDSGTTSSGGGLIRELGALDATMIVAGSMIGSGIFIVPADIARHVGAPGLLVLVWIIAGLLTIAAALSYGELAGMMPQAGGQYVYLREAFSPLWGFLYGWTLFLVIQTGTIAAVAVAFARFLGVIAPGISATAWIVKPIHVSSGYALSLSTQQFVGILLIALLTLLNCRGIHLGKLVQNTFTITKTLALIGLIVLGVLIFRKAEVAGTNFADAWTPRGVNIIKPDFSIVPVLSAGDGWLGLIVAFCVAQVGSLFSMDAWNNVTFAAGEVKNPRRDVGLAMVAGTGLVIALYTLANIAYLCLLPFDGIQHAADDRVGTAALGVIFGGAGAAIMAVAISISTFGCNNGLILAGSRVYYAMAKDGLFFQTTGRLNARHAPAVALLLQGIWASLLVLPRTILRNPDGTPKLDPTTGLQQYGNLYSDLLDYVIFSALIFYVLTTVGLFVLRRKRPHAERPYRAVGYPVVPVIYILGACVILTVLALYKTQTTWPGLVIVLTGIPVYAVWRVLGRGRSSIDNRRSLTDNGPP